MPAHGQTRGIFYDPLEGYVAGSEASGQLGSSTVSVLDRHDATDRGVRLLYPCAELSAMHLDKLY